MQSLASLSEAERAREWDRLTPDLRAQIPHWWETWARDNQFAPDGDWRIWLLLAGRGFGKSRTGAEWIREEVRTGRGRRIALVAPTAADARDIMVDTLIGCYPEKDRPLYESSKRRVTWRSGATATLYSAEDPDQLRGPNHDTAWADELAAWKRPETWTQLQLTLRKGQARCVVTTTPRPTEVIKSLLKRADVTVTRGSTYDNRANLTDSYFSQIIRQYEGTRLGRQELNAEVLEDAPGALWTLGQLDRLRVAKVPCGLVRIALAIDPAVSSGEDSDDTGIVVAGLGEDGHGYVLADLTVHESPAGWARSALNGYARYSCGTIVAEKNQGGEMVEHTLRSTCGPNEYFRYQPVHAAQGKLTRAEPVSALYEQGRVHHVGCFPELEDQMTTWLPGDKSPDRMDALVHALTFLFPNSFWGEAAGATIEPEPGDGRLERPIGPLGRLLRDDRDERNAHGDEDKEFGGRRRWR